MKNNHARHGNKITSTVCCKAIVACALLSLLAACGQRGSLYIPTAPEAAQRSTIVDTLTKPAASTAPTSTTQPASSTNSAPAK
jgi:predicted small lipoprotein YifL